jgi:MYXO-CTERM domain-containing protein
MKTKVKRWLNSSRRNFVYVIFIIVLLLIGNQFGFAQGFVNLDFEDAVIIHDPSSGYPNAVYASDAIPGWTTTGGFLGSNDILYNTPSAGSTSVSILATNGHPSALDGNFSVGLYGGGTASSASISQTGLVPVSAKSILFVAQGGGAPGAVILLVSLGGQNIPFYALSTVAPYTSVYGGNIPPTFAGQIEQLTFSALEGENFWNIDDVQFSSSSVPEPSEFALAALGALLLGFRRRRNFFTRR